MEAECQAEESRRLADAKLRLYPLGSGILFAYPQLATLAGVQGVVVYALSSALPLLIFAALGPIIRRKCPQGFVLTEWTRQRYGTFAALYLSFMTLVTLFLYMVSELSAIGQVVNLLTGIDGLPVLIVSFFTDNIQGAMVMGLILIATIAIGVETKIDTSLIESSGPLDRHLYGRRRRAHHRRPRRLDRPHRRLGGHLARHAEEPVDGSVAFFALLMQLPNWVVGFVVVMSVTLSTAAAFDSFQSAMVTSASNDLFRNKLNIWSGRAGFEVVVGGLGGLFTVFLFGTVYYGDAQKGAELMLLQQGLYTADWGAFGAFVAAPIGGLLWGFGALALRLGIQFVKAKLKGERFDGLDRPLPLAGPQLVEAEAGGDSVLGDEESASDAPGLASNKFFYALMQARDPVPSVNDPELLATAIREAETDWNRTATLLTTKLYDKASELRIDLSDTSQTEYELTLEIEALKAQGKRRQNATVEEERAMRLRLYVLEKKLAALRDLGNALLWIRADGQAVYRSPASCEIPGAAGEEGVEAAGDSSRLEMASMAVKLSKKLALLEEEVRKVKDAAATLEDLGWEPDEAPLTVMLLFS
ncbi:hypothetical protein NEMBOFW57_001585 [Staphylotrichum longicolle]|uniref:Urea transporter n=1 Tax=Staphylotrichum longicolle TaxID=669026 RepID=A0AAD4F1F4_9PEZI|nr:hypothetical protein NEMBOFW57_001585 [Staphylotrichum longicolle]